jgi:hypothetical protein
LNAGPLSNLDKYYGKDNEFWQQLKDHSSYDDFGRNVEFAFKEHQASSDDSRRLV